MSRKQLIQNILLKNNQKIVCLEEKTGLVGYFNLNFFKTILSNSCSYSLTIWQIEMDIQQQILKYSLILNQFASKNIFKLNQQMNTTGSIQIIYGPMFSGKSSELLRKIRRFQHAHKRCLVLNFSHDNRYSNSQVMATHDKVTKQAMKVTELTPILEMIQKYDVIGIDQGQFFPDIVEFCQNAANEGKIVVVAALDGTFERKPFGNIINLIPLAQKVQKLCAVCVYCTQEAAFTKRIVQSKQIQLIGGAQMYKPVCRECFFLEHQTKQSQSTICNVASQLSQNVNPQKQQVIKISV